MILKNDTRIYKNNTKILQSLSGLAITTDQEYFPHFIGPFSSGILQLQFNSASAVVIVDWGDGSSMETFDNLPLYEGYYQIRFYDQAPSSPFPKPIDQPPHHYLDWVAGTGLTGTRHLVSIYYAVADLHGIILNNYNLPTQDFAFGFAKHNNLVVFSSSVMKTTASGDTTGAIKELDLLNTGYLKKFTNLGINNIFNVASTWYGALPEPLINPPLQVLAFGDSGFTGRDFSLNKMNTLPHAAATLQQVSISYPIADTNGTGADNGPLPANFNQLKNLYYFNTRFAAWTQPPPILNTMPWLTDLYFVEAIGMNSWGDLSALVNLDFLSVNGSYLLPVSVPAWFASVPLLKTLNMQGCFPASGPGHVAGEIDSFISNLHAFVVTHATATAWRGVHFDIGNYPSIPADTPSAGSITLLNDFETTYGWTVIHA